MTVESSSAAIEPADRPARLAEAEPYNSAHDARPCDPERWLSTVTAPTLNVDKTERGDGADVAELDGIYRTRFDERRQAGKMAVWAEIARYLARWVDPSRPALDVACDAGYFIRHVRASERWATDVRDVADLLPPTIRFVQADGLALASILPTGHYGTIFMSNYLEHLSGVDDVIRQLQVARDLLAPGGRLIVLQPNVRLTGGSYWDFIDHRVPLTEKSLLEAVGLARLRPIHVTARFLPYSTRGRLPQYGLLVRWYLRLPLLWRVFGKQTLVVAERSRDAAG